MDDYADSIIARIRALIDERDDLKEENEFLRFLLRYLGMPEEALAKIKELRGGE